MLKAVKTENKKQLVYETNLIIILIMNLNK